MDPELPGPHRVFAAKALELKYWRWANLRPIRDFLKSEITKGRYQPSLKVGLYD